MNYGELVPSRAAIPFPIKVFVSFLPTNTSRVECRIMKKVVLVFKKKLKKSTTLFFMVLYPIILCYAEMLHTPTTYSLVLVIS